MPAQLFLFEPRRYGLWSEMDRRVQGLYSTLEDAIIRRQTGGRFELSRRWSNTRWQVETGGLGKRAIAALMKRGFVRWEGDDLVVVHYDPTWEIEAAKRSARLTKRGKDAANTRWQEVRRRAALARGQAASPNFLPSKKPCDSNEASPPVSSAAPGSTPRSKLSPNPAESLTPPHASGIAKPDARARARARLPLQEHDLWIPEPVEDPSPQTDRPTPEDRGRVSAEEGPAEGPVESVGWGSLTLGEQRVWKAYPRVYRPWDRLGRFAQAWRRHGLEWHADWVLELLSEFKLSRGWERDKVPLIDNWIENKIAPETLDRPVVDGCTANCCRGKWARGVLGADGQIKTTTPPEIKAPPRYPTPEELEELRTFRKNGRLPT